MFRRVTLLSANPEAYRLEVGSDGVVISAATDAGLFYGAVTLLAIAQPGRGTGRADRRSRFGNRRCPALCLARNTSRFFAAFSVAGLREVVHRRDGAAQAQCPALAFDGRSGLAAADQAISQTDLGRRLAAGSRTVRRLWRLLYPE